MNSGGLPCSSPVAPAAAVIGPPPGPGVPTAAVAPGGLKLKFCRYYAKDKTCFYGEECQFLHEEPGGASAACPGPPPPVALGGLPLGLPPGSAAPSVAVAASPGHGGSAGYPAHGVAAPGAGPKKPPELLGGGGGAGGGGGLDGPRLAIPGIDGSALAEASLTDSYFSTSFVGVNGFGSPAESKYPMMQRMTNSSSSPSLLNDSAKPYAGHDPLSSPSSSLFNDFAALSLSQRRKPRKYRLGMLEERIVPVGSKARKSKNTIGCLADRCKTGVPVNMVWWNRVTENNLQAQLSVEVCRCPVCCTKPVSYRSTNDRLNNSSVQLYQQLLGQFELSESTQEEHTLLCLFNDVSNVRCPFQILDDYRNQKLKRLYYWYCVA